MVCDPIVAHRPHIRVAAPGTTSYSHQGRNDSTDDRRQYKPTHDESPRCRMGAAAGSRAVSDGLATADPYQPAAIVSPVRRVAEPHRLRRPCNLNTRVKITVIVCAHNEEAFITACACSLLAQSRPPDEIVVVNNASSDRTGDTARRLPDVRVIDEARKGLVVARERGRQEATGDLLVYVDADCRAPLQWLERIERHFERDPALVALSGNYRFYDWDWSGRLLLRAYDLTLGPATHVLAKYILQIGVVFYGGNFAVRREALDRIGGRQLLHDGVGCLPLRRKLLSR